MARPYYFTFGSGNPSTYGSLSPTFIVFMNSSGQTFTPPAIAETYPGSGFYKAVYGATTQMVGTLDGATTGLLTSDRYIPFMFDPQDEFGVTLNAIGLTTSGIGVTLSGVGVTLFGVGSTVFGIGSTLFGMGNTLFSVGSTLTQIGTNQTNMGTTLVYIGDQVGGIGTSFGFISGLLGDPTSSYGTTVPPTTVFGFLRRSQEFWEGDETYTKASGVLDFYDQGGTLLLRSKQITDDIDETTKT